MAFKKKPPEPEEEPGAPEWMLTFSDCMTLLLTFFVLLISFSNIGRDTIPALRDGFRKIMPAFKLADKMYRNTMSTAMNAEPVDATLKGSEHATLEQGTGGQLRETKGIGDPFEPRVFLIPSNKVFAGRATAISPQGREYLDTLAAYLKRVTNGVIIGEHGSAGSRTNETIGLLRASAVADYLTTKGGLERNRFGISSAIATSAQGTEMAGGKTPERMLEIVLLGQGINK